MSANKLVFPVQVPEFNFILPSLTLLYSLCLQTCLHPPFFGDTLQVSSTGGGRFLPRPILIQYKVGFVNLMTNLSIVLRSKLFRIKFWIYTDLGAARKSTGLCPLVAAFFDHLFTNGLISHLRSAAERPMLISSHTWKLILKALFNSSFIDWMLDKVCSCNLSNHLLNVCKHEMKTHKPVCQ